MHTAASEGNASLSVGTHLDIVCVLVCLARSRGTFVKVPSSVLCCISPLLAAAVSWEGFPSDGRV